MDPLPKHLIAGDEPDRFHGRASHKILHKLGPQCGPFDYGASVRQAGLVSMHDVTDLRDDVDPVMFEHVIKQLIDVES